MATLTDNEPTTKDKDKKFTVEKLRKKDTLTLIVGDYLDAKIAKMTTIKKKDITDDTPIDIPEKYNNVEGTIEGYDKIAGWVKGLRIDLQKSQVHNGHHYACWQVQWGTGGAGDPNNKKGGAYCGALMLCGTQFTVGDLRKALTNSWGTRTYWRID